jgi:hypothetical protein
MVITYEYVSCQFNKLLNIKANTSSHYYMEIYADFYYLIILFMLLQSLDMAHMSSMLAIVELTIAYANFFVDFCILHINLKKIIQSTRIRYEKLLDTCAESSCAKKSNS